MYNSKLFEIKFDDLFSILSRYEDGTRFAQKTFICFSSANDFGSNQAIWCEEKIRYVKSTIDIDLKNFIVRLRV